MVNSEEARCDTSSREKDTGKTFRPASRIGMEAALHYGEYRTATQTKDHPNDRYLFQPDVA